MTLGNLRTLVRAMIPASKALPTDNTLLDLVINMAVNDLNAYAKCLKTSSTFNATLDDGDYDIATVISDYVCPDAPGLWYYNGTQWVQMHPRTLKWLDENRPNWRNLSSGTPYDYSIDGNVLTVVPKPSATTTNGFKLYHIEKAAAMTATGHYPFTGSTTEYPQFTIFDDAIIEYCKWKINPMINKNNDGSMVDISELAYRRIREEKTALYNRRPDISASRYTKMQGPRVNS